MAACHFVITHIGTELNIRGQEMVRVRGKAVESEPFEMPVPEGATAADPDGQFSVLLNKAAMKGKSLGDTLALEFRS